MKYVTGSFCLVFLLLLLYLLFRIWLEGRRERIAPREIPGDTLPEELRASYEPLLTGEKQAEMHDLVKAADKLSAYIKCIEERKAGNNDS